MAILAGRTSLGSSDRSRSSLEDMRDGGSLCAESTRLACAWLEDFVERVGTHLVILNTL